MMMGYKFDCEHVEEFSKYPCLLARAQVHGVQLSQRESALDVELKQRIDSRHPPRLLN